MLRGYVLVQCFLTLVGLLALLALEDFLRLSVFLIDFAIYFMVLQRPRFFERFPTDLAHELFLFLFLFNLLVLFLNFLYSACRHEHLIEHYGVFGCVERGSTLD